MAARGREWWRSAAVYQVFLRSFADGNGDGIGDIAGLRARLPHLAALGVDAIWVNPWYPSPMVDAGYDVADYRDVDPVFGTLAEAEALVGEAHALGLRVLLDVVPNHTSDAHAWFTAALAGDERARARYLFRPGRGERGELPPNDWDSSFRGPAWTRTTLDGTPDGEPGEWYLHLFAPQQPDLDWSNPQVRAELLDVLRFWFDRGVDGFRVDVAHGLAKAPGLPDALGADRRTQAHPGWDQDGVHEVYREWRALADSYDPPRVFVAEAWLARPERLPLYVRPDELHTAFAFEPLHVAWRAAPWRAVVDRELAFSHVSGAPSAWALTNHDVVRQVTRYARSQPDEKYSNEEERGRWGTEEPDLQRGRWRARAALLLTAALPGVVYVYTGEELGLPEVEEIPSQRRVDPIHARSGGTDPGRDGCRVPVPWSGDAPPYGFSPPGSSPPGFSPPGAGRPWLPQPPDWAPLSAAAQEVDPNSTLHLYRCALHLRRQLLTGPEPLVWLDAPDGVLAFSRGSTQCWVRFGDTGSDTGTDTGTVTGTSTDAGVALPAGMRVALSSRPGTGTTLPPDTAAWLVPLTDEDAP